MSDGDGDVIFTMGVRAKFHPPADLLDAARDALAFIDRVEAHGYGGDADHMVAQIKLRSAIERAERGMALSDLAELDADSIGKD